MAEAVLTPPEELIRRTAAAAARWMTLAFFQQIVASMYIGLWLFVGEGVGGWIGVHGAIACYLSEATPRLAVAESVGWSS